MKNFLYKLCVIFSLTQGIVWGDISVTNLLDAGSGSLREALTIAEEGDQIVFDASLLGTLVLLSPLPTVDVDIEILGPTSNGVSISGNSLVPIFDVGINQQVSISNLNIINGSKTGSGAGLFIGDASMVTLANCTFSNCTATGSAGGAIHVGIDSTLKAVEVSFSSNSSGGPGDDIFLSNSSVLQYACSGTISSIELFGTGSAFKSGTGQVTFTVPGSAALTLVVQEGTLISTGVRTEPTIVYGTLEGSQTSLYASNHGTLKPSETIGTSVTTGDYYQDSSATLEIGVNPSASDLLQIGGNAYLQGTLSIVPEVGTYTVGARYTILTTGGAINSPFNLITASSMTFDVIYFTDHIDIEVTSL